MPREDPSTTGVPDAASGPVRPSAAAVVRAAVQPRMLVLLLVFVAAALVCARLGIWQLDRAHARGEVARQQELAEQAAGGPVALGSVLAPQSAMSGSLVGTLVSLEGTFEPEGQLYVSGRALDGEVGYLVLTPLRVSDDGTGTGSWADLSGPPVLAVVRGWVPSPDVDLLPPPEDAVQVSGYLQSSEALGEDAFADRITDTISSGALANRWGGPIYSSYLVLADSDPAPDPAIGLLPRPTIEGGTGLDLQNVFYAIQWWIFGLFVVVLWGRLVLDEARGSAADGFTGWEGLQPR
ncbi:MAG: SURF1 family protein [Cellulomonadaceae bacterium]